VAPPPVVPPPLVPLLPSLQPAAAINKNAAIQERFIGSRLAFEVPEVKRSAGPPTAQSRQAADESRHRVRDLTPKPMRPKRLR
jgi:hypothetical protein